MQWIKRGETTHRRGKAQKTRNETDKWIKREDDPVIRTFSSFS